LFRIEYHEVTKKAILKAVEEKRQINENLVRAQIVRRVADRWV
jgi:reverse gyrase